nr:ribonuclease H-like domain-containing protein [Tanacetum cinerariifolium]
MHDPREPHLAALKRILRYIRGTLDFGFHLYSSTTISLVGYTDADWAGCPSTRRSTSGYCVFLGDNLLSWSSKRQQTISHSSAEAKYQGVANVVAETAWLRNLLRELHSSLSAATLVYCDNVSATYLSANPVQHQRTKHIEIDIHFVRDLLCPLLMVESDDVNDTHDTTFQSIDLIGSSSDLNLSFSDVLYLHPNNTGGSPIVTIKLTGTENYEAFAIISGEESHRNATSHVTTKPTATVFAAKAFDNKRRPNNSNNFPKNRGPNLNLTCIHYDKPGHTVDRCYELNRYPASYMKRNFNAKLTVSNNAFASANVLAKNSGTDNKTSNFPVSLWHQRLGHRADQVLNVLNKSLNLDSQSISDHLCDTCNKAKQTRENFSLSGHKSTKIRQLVHLDDWGPYKIISRYGFRYFLTVVDDYSRAVWTYMLKGKDDVYDSIVNFVNMLSKQFETNMKVFRSDNGFEFINNKLQSLFNEKGILHQTLCVYTPQQNGIAERKHRHLLNDDYKATSMSENTHPEGNVSNETNVSSEIDSAGDINDNSEPISKIGDLPVNTVRRSMRQTKLPSSLNDCIINGKHVILDNNWIEHVILDAMNSEIEALNKNHTWIITDLPPNRKPIKCKWIYKIKYKSSRDIKSYKARLVAKGFSQREGIDFDEIFSPVVKMTTVRCVIALSVENKRPLFQLDVNNAFLYGDLDEEIYMTIPQGFSDKDNKGKVCKLVKSLYGLKQAPRKWNEKLVGVLKDHGFTQSVNDYSLFTLTKKDKFIALLVYVDDIASTVIKTGNDLCLTRRKYCLELLKKYGLLGCKRASTPMEPNSLLPYVPTDSGPLLDNITGYQQLLGINFGCLSVFLDSPSSWTSTFGLMVQDSQR